MPRRLLKLRPYLGPEDVFLSLLDRMESARFLFSISCWLCSWLRYEIESRSYDCNLHIEKDLSSQMKPMKWQEQGADRRRGLEEIPGNWQAGDDRLAGATVPCDVRVDA